MKILSWLKRKLSPIVHIESKDELELFNAWYKKCWAEYAADKEASGCCYCVPYSESIESSSVFSISATMPRAEYEQMKHWDKEGRP